MAIFKDSLKVMVISLLVSLSVYLVLAQVSWTEPSATPPGGNVAAPLNTGSTGQSKSGGLILNTGGAANGLIVSSGNVGIGTTSPYQTLSVAGNLSLGNNRLMDLAAPIALTDAATKGYVDASSVGGLKPKLQTFTTSGTWVKPAGVDVVWVTVVGGGGGGGNGAVTCLTCTHVSGGGGGGGQSFVHYPVSVVGDVTVTIGAGGGPNVNGSNSSFGSIIADSGKKGGVGSGTGGASGQGGGGGGITSSGTAENGETVGYGGGNGGKGGSGGGVVYGGGGGSSWFGNGGDASSGGGNGGLYGGGGGGGYGYTTGGPGGSGAAGLVIVEWLE